MTGFDTKAERFLRQAENKYPVPFEVQHNIVFCEKVFPMTAGFLFLTVSQVFLMKTLKLCSEKHIMKGRKLFFPNS